MPAWWEQLLHLTLGRVHDHESLPDLRHLPSRRVTVERTHYVVNDRERQHDRNRLYVLRLAPGHRRRRPGIAVFSNGRDVGYLPDRVAFELAPLVDRLGGSVVVNGAGSVGESIRLRVDVPTHAALHAFAHPPV